jgi:hypothetical protein
VDGESLLKNASDIIVDQKKGPIKTIREAMESANFMDRILIKPGTYREEVFWTKPLELVGSGNREEIVLQFDERSTITFTTSWGRISNLMIRHNGSEGGVGYVGDQSIFFTIKPLQLHQTDARRRLMCATAGLKSLYVTSGLRYPPPH